MSAPIPAPADAAGLTTAAPFRSGRWSEDPGFGVYVHIPFCLHRCHYCDFNAYAGQGDLHGPYVDALCRSIERWQGSVRPATSVFFGGGTPSLLPARELARVLDAVRSLTGLAPGAEVTIEVNPETVDETAFEALLEAGFGRFSVGVQSLSAPVLRALGRQHPPEVALAALRAARQAGVSDLNVDLIYGSPWETPQDWQASLEGALAFGPEHLSIYALTVEEGTPLASLVAARRVPDVDEDVQADRWAYANVRLRAAGYERYEVSNHCLPGHASRHNVLYWSAGDYLGFGAGAHGHLEGRRWWNVRLPRDFIAAVSSRRSVEAGFETLSADARVGEALMLGLRLDGGVDLAGFERRFGGQGLHAREPVVSKLIGRGLLERDGGRLRLGAHATLVANEALAALL